MGTYYLWSNATKHQYLGYEPFEAGLKVIENCFLPNMKTDAVLTLLATDWAGDLVAFVPDSGDWSAAYLFDDDEWEEFMGQVKDCCFEFGNGPDVEGPFGYAEDYFDDVAGQFKSARGHEMMVHDPLGVIDDIATRYKPYEGSFDRDVVHYRYVVNETRREYLCRDGIRLECAPSCDWDPFPLLMALSRNKLGMGMDRVGFDGIWIGDLIRPTNEPPGEVFRNITGVYDLW